MQVTVTLTDKELKFLQAMVNHKNGFENITTIEEAIHECIETAIFDEGEHFAQEEGM